VRLSGGLNKRDGFATNVTTGNDVNNRDRWSIRGDLLWLPTDETSVRIIADYNKISEVCCGVFRSSTARPPSSSARPAVRPGQACRQSGHASFDRDVVFNTDPSNKLVGKGISGQVDHDPASPS
jgi:iron complex outermembrane receptor protein